MKFKKFTESIVLLTLFVTSCATNKPLPITDGCLLLKSKQGIFSSWKSSLQSAEKKYQIPSSIILAIIYTESKFKADARPAHKKLFGFLPLFSHLSTAYGYSQALEGTWAEYQRATNNPYAMRSNFSDAVDFIGWFLRNKSVNQNHIAPNDPFHLYLSYYYGSTQYPYVLQHIDATAHQAAAQTAHMALLYYKQLRSCIF